MKTRYASYWKEGNRRWFETPSCTYRNYSFLFFKWKRLELEILENPVVARAKRINAIRLAKGIKR